MTALIHRFIEDYRQHRWMREQSRWKSLLGALGSTDSPRLGATQGARGVDCVALNPVAAASLYQSLVITGIIGAAAWLYQKAWERQQQRVARYQEIIDRTPAFTEGGLDRSKVDETLAVIRQIKSRQTGEGNAIRSPGQKHAKPS